MKHLKLALLISAVAAFTVACESANTTVFNADSNNANPASTPAAASSPAPAPASDDLAAARSTYQAVCAGCHKQGGEGGIVEMDDGGKLKVPSFKTGHGLTHTEAQFARQIAKGGDGMPAFEKRLTPEQINGLVRFIRQEIQAGLLKNGAAHPSH